MKVLIENLLPLATILHHEFGAGLGELKGAMRGAVAAVFAHARSLLPRFPTIPNPSPAPISHGLVGLASLTRPASAAIWMSWSGDSSETASSTSKSLSTTLPGPWGRMEPNFQAYLHKQLTKRRFDNGGLDPLVQGYNRFLV